MSKRVLWERVVSLLLFFACYSSQASFAQEKLLSKSYIQGIWSGLEPTSLIEYLSFLELYADSQEGELARKRIKERLDLSGDLSLDIPSLGHSIVDYLLLKSDKERDLDIKLIEWIEAASQQQLEAPKEGRTVKSLSELTTLEPQKWDFTQVAFLASRLGEPYDERLSRSLHAKVDMLALCVKLSLHGQSFSSTTEKDLATVKALNRVVFEELGFSFPPILDYESRIDQFSSLPSLIDSRRGVCLGVSVLYLCIADRLGLPLTLVTPPGHIFLRYKYKEGELEKERNIETTAYGMQLPNLAYRPLLGEMVVERKTRELPGLILINQASTCLSQANFAKAKKIYEVALEFLDRKKSFFVDELHAYAGFLADPQTGLAKIKSLSKSYRELQSRGELPALVFDPLLLEEISQGILGKEELADYFQKGGNELSKQLQKMDRLEKFLKKAPTSNWLKLQLSLVKWHLGRCSSAASFFPKEVALDSQRLYMRTLLLLDSSLMSEAVESFIQLEKQLKEEDKSLWTPFYRLRIQLQENYFALLEN